MLQSFPLLAVSLVIFTMLNVVTRGQLDRPWHEAEAFTVQLMSSDVWHISGGDAFLMMSMLFLFIELVRSTRSDNRSIVNHAFSVLVFVGAFMLLLTQPGFGNSTFVIFMVMTLIDFMAGFIITAVAARRDMTFQRARAARDH